MKFNAAMFKSKPVLYGGAFLVFFFVVLHFLNKSAATDTSAAGVTVAGVDPNQLAAQVALSTASLQAQTQMATVDAQLQASQAQTQAATDQATIAANLQLAEANIAASANQDNNAAQLQALQVQTQAQVQENEDNNTFQIGYSKLAYDSADAMLATNAALQENITAQSIQANTIGSILAAGTALKSKGIVGGLMNQYLASLGNSGTNGTVLVPNLPSNAAMTGNSPTMH